jgi:hypothetical protein
MPVEIKITCPLGSECERVVDGVLERCAWYTCLKGKNPQGEDIIDEWGCAIAWLPIMSVEVAQTNRGQTHAIESFRDETLKLASTTPTIRRIDRGQ